MKEFKYDDAGKFIVRYMNGLDAKKAKLDQIFQKAVAEGYSTWTKRSIRSHLQTLRTQNKVTTDRSHWYLTGSGKLDAIKFDREARTSSAPVEVQQAQA